ncbi:MAG: ABC transporter permease [Gemmatimonadota bacterium]|nr:ABC transporter permease [Gemmatimonadota bacterium]
MSLRRDLRVRVALGVLLVVMLSGLLAPLLAPYDPSAQLDIARLQTQSPSLAHPFGTDVFSRDVLSRVLYGTRVSMSVAFIAVSVSMIFGTCIGALSGYAGGMIDAIVMRFVDAALSIPAVLLLIVVIALWGHITVVALTLLLAAVGWFGVSRIVRIETLAVRDTDYVIAARALGMPAWRILLKHVMPNALGPAIVTATLSIGNVILLEAGLSYLGIGVRPPTPSWGNIIEEGSTRFADAWWLTLFPGLAILITVFACNALGDALRDALDPRQLHTMHDDAPFK